VKQHTVFYDGTVISNCREEELLLVLGDTMTKLMNNFNAYAFVETEAKSLRDIRDDFECCANRAISIVVDDKNIENYIASLKIFSTENNCVMFKQ
jgi:hypothetical protein